MAVKLQEDKELVKMAEEKVTEAKGQSDVLKKTLAVSKASMAKAANALRASDEKAAQLREQLKLALATGNQKVKAAQEEKLALELQMEQEKKTRQENELKKAEEALKRTQDLELEAIDEVETAKKAKEEEEFK